MPVLAYRDERGNRSFVNPVDHRLAGKFGSSGVHPHCHRVGFRHVHRGYFVHEQELMDILSVCQDVLSWIKTFWG